MEDKELIPNLFRIEYQKIVSVLINLFGIKHIEIAEDIVSDTFLAATEVWSMKGIPENPTAWLYTVAKNKTKNYFKRTSLYEQKISPEIKYNSTVQTNEVELDLSEKNIADSQLAMIFTICDPCNPSEAQIALALNLLCGFGTHEIADAFMTNKEVIYKRINRAKQKLKDKNIQINGPTIEQMKLRQENVLKTIYLLFSEGYYSSIGNTVLRKDFCTEAMRLTYLLLQNTTTNLPNVNALMALMCFHTSRFDTRTNENGDIVLYQDQDEELWNQELVSRGAYYLGKASVGDTLSKYHLEAGIAYWHTQKKNTQDKWKNILELYNNLLVIDYSPIVALNRAFVISKIEGNKAGIIETEMLQLLDNHFYFSLLGNLHLDIDNQKALQYFEQAYALAHTDADKKIIKKYITNI
ncbi:RNA polymerase sigma factor [Flavobacterium sp. ARAG 55.4]|uniref:RNA polymerase sigma factor n=1 Tax=Flavobacterium sp. ARAG 55.4 TaxID=3451357 RepID=UPI003F476598